jgi:predicted NodU family carbamoyl transferase
MNILGLVGAVGHGICFNFSLNRSGEPMVSSPINMLDGAGLQSLIMTNILA